MRNILEEIQETLLEIEKQENVTILLAVESGSRAWGFASLDSDYDVRFIYARRSEDYLKLKEKKDVIEWQLDDVLDINGWDLNFGHIRLLWQNTVLDCGFQPRLIFAQYLVKFCVKGSVLRIGILHTAAFIFIWIRR